MAGDRSWLPGAPARQGVRHGHVLRSTGLVVFTAALHGLTLLLPHLADDLLDPPRSPP